MFSDSFKNDVEKLKEDNISGSEEIVSKAIAIVKEEINHQPSHYQTFQQLLEMLNEIRSAKPEMAAVKNIVIYFLDFFQKGVPVLKLADRVYDKLEHQRIKLQENLLVYLKRAKTIATYSRSSSIASGLKVLSETKQPEELPTLIMFESRPMLEGKNFAIEAASWGYNIKFFSDAGMAMAIRKFEPDYVLVGADTIFPDGYVANKLGSVALALIAREYGIPFYVVSSTLKLILQEKEFSIQNYPSSELWEGEKPENVQVFNPYFEIVPAKYISGYITEYGFSKTINDLKINIEKAYIREMYD